MSAPVRTEMDLPHGHQRDPPDGTLCAICCDLFGASLVSAKSGPVILQFETYDLCDRDFRLDIAEP